MAQEAPIMPTQEAPIMPTKPVLEKRTYTATISYVGSFKRIFGWRNRMGEHLGTWGVIGITAAAMLFWLLALVGVTVYYLVLYGIFGILLFPFLFPFRAIRRSQRRREHLEEAQLAAMQASLLRQTEMAQHPKAES